MSEQALALCKYALVQLIYRSALTMMYKVVSTKRLLAVHKLIKIPNNMRASTKLSLKRRLKLEWTK